VGACTVGIHWTILKACFLSYILFEKFNATKVCWKPCPEVPGPEIGCYSKDKLPASIYRYNLKVQKPEAGRVKLSILSVAYIKVLRGSNLNDSLVC
jgi:hypothetical protein